MPLETYRALNPSNEFKIPASQHTVSSDWQLRPKEVEFTLGGKRKGRLANNLVVNTPKGAQTKAIPTVYSQPTSKAIQPITSPVLAKKTPTSITRLEDIPDNVIVIESLYEGAPIHEVKKGDTLYNLSKRYNTSIDKLMELNQLESYSIRIGQRLYLPTE